MQFSFQAIDETGKVRKGKHDAADKNAVISYLKAQHWTPVSVELGQSDQMAETFAFMNKAPKVEDLSMFCEQFCSLLRAGITVLETLQMLGEQTENAALQKGIMQAITGINEGESLATAMRRSPKAFDETLVSLVRAGEASGSLDVSLERMAVQYKKDAHIKSSVKKAISYPIIVLVVAFAVVIFMLLVVVPNFMDMFDDIGIEMPKITLMVVAASEWVQQYWYILAIIIIALVSGFVLFKKSATGHKALSWLTLHLPGVNQFVVKSNAAKIARTLSTLLAAGMSIIEAVDILRSTMSNYYYEQAIDAVRKDILTGRQMSAKFREAPDLFPNMLVHMISVGEDTGDTTSMLVRTADYYDMEVDGAVSTMMDMLSPAIMLLLVGIVGVLIAAVLMPMVTLYSELGDAL